MPPSPGVADRVALRTGDRMPLLGLGTWKIPKSSCASLVRRAIDEGWRHLDCACDYGNEREVGAGIKAALDAGACARSDLWVTSKLWNTYHRREHVRAACVKTLEDLGVDYLDLYLIHFPISLAFVPFETRYPPEWVHDPDAPDPADRVMKYDPVSVAETWAAMEALVDEGLVRNVGVCNFNAQLLAELLACAESHPPAVLQVESHPYLTQTNLLRFAEAHGVHVTAFSPLGSAGYVEMGWTTEDEGAINEPVVREAAARRGASPGQILLRWATQRGTSAIPKTTKEERLVENIAVFDETRGFDLTPEEMAAIEALNRGKRYNDPAEFCPGMGGLSPIYD
jgi:diketogulonate reductase-like aldo/keto reductase